LREKIRRQTLRILPTAEGDGGAIPLINPENERVNSGADFLDKRLIRRHVGNRIHRWVEEKRDCFVRLWWTRNDGETRYVQRTFGSRAA